MLLERLKMKFFVTALSLVHSQIVIQCTSKYMRRLSAMFSGTDSTVPTIMPETEVGILQ